jgi:hypothetical protein
MVSGRTFPVEQLYRTFEEARDYDLNDAIAAGVAELWRDPPRVEPMKSSSRRKASSDQPTGSAPKRKPPRLTPAIIKYANQCGYNVRIIQKPDGTTETELTKPGLNDPREETSQHLRKLL